MVLRDRVKVGVMEQVSERTGKGRKCMRVAVFEALRFSCASQVQKEAKKKRSQNNKPGAVRRSRNGGGRGTAVAAERVPWILGRGGREKEERRTRSGRQREEVLRRVAQKSCRRREGEPVV